MHPYKILRAAALLTSFGLFAACNKNNDTPAGNDNSVADLQTQADDQAFVTNEDEAVSNDVNTALYTEATNQRSSERTAANSDQRIIVGPLKGIICDASITVSEADNVRTITIVYDGSNCAGNRTRTGTIVLTMASGVHWADKGALINESINNLVITRLRDNKSMTFNGSRTFTNVSGGLIENLSSLGSITHTVEGALTVTFDNGKQRAWNVAKQKVFTYNNGIVLTVTGTHADSNGNNNVAVWGTNRFGTEFESLITQAKVFRQDCDFRLTAGQNELIRADDIKMIVTYGLNADGNPTSCPGTGSYYMKIVINKKDGTQVTKIVAY